MKKKTALITGGCGFSASHLIRLLLENDWCVRVTDLPNAPKTNLLEFADKIQFIPGDITKPETLNHLFDDIDVVFHTAAIFSYTAPISILRKVNVEGTKNLLDKILDSDVQKVVLWSSSAVYGLADPKFYKIPIPELPIDNLNPKHGGNYDLSKREQESAALTYWQDNELPITFMRLASLYGPRSYYGIYYLIKYIRDEVLNFIPINLHKSSMSLIHAEDVARAALFLSDPKKYNGEIFNVSDDNNLDFVDTMKYIAWLTNSKFKVTYPMYRKLLFQIFRIIGAWSRFEARFLRKKVNGKTPRPKLEIDSLRYVLGTYWTDNTKLLKTGFKLKYPDRRIGFVETIKWYEKNGWVRDNTKSLNSIDAEFYEKMKSDIEDKGNCWNDIDSINYVDHSQDIGGGT